MPIIIKNLSSIAGDGPRQYGVYLNDELRFRFIHVRREPLSALLRRAADAAKEVEVARRAGGDVA